MTDENEALEDGPTPTDEVPAEEAAATEETPSELALVKEERDRIKDQLLRTAADFDNFRKRARREVDEARRRAREDVLREILPVVDNLERAVASSDGVTDVTAVVDGVRMVLRGFEATAQALGLERIAALGERFDPSQHDALQQVESAEHAAGTIVAEVAAGYRLGERLLRAAQVVVSKGPGAAVAAEPQDDADAGDADESDAPTSSEDS